MKKKLILVIIAVSISILSFLLYTSQNSSFDTINNNSDKKVQTNENTDTTGISEQNATNSNTKNLIEKNSDKNTTDSKKEIVFTNLINPSVLKEITDTLEKEGINKTNIETFTKQVNHYYKSVGTENMQDAFSPLQPPAYDTYLLQDNWNKNNDYIGYNCRLTAFTLIKDLFTANTNEINKDFLDILTFDHSTMEAEKYSKEEINAFNKLFQSFPTKNSRSVSEQSEILLAARNKQGFKFKDGNVKLVTVYLHNHDGIKSSTDTLFVGHTGVLLPYKGQYLFIEKLTFSEPYSATKFTNLEQLKKYLLEKYDTSASEPVSQPIILVNNELI